MLPFGAYYGKSYMHHAQKKIYKLRIFIELINFSLL